MGGMALGSWLLSRWMHSKFNPLKIYAYLEIFIGLYAILCFNPLLQTFFDLYGVIYQYELFKETTYGQLIKFLSCSAVLLLPSMMMGATFPAMVVITRKFKSSIGSSVALSYSINSGGAVLGSLAMAFLLLPWFGMQANLMLCGMASSIVGLICLILGRNFDHVEDSFQGTQRPHISFLRIILLLLILMEGILGFSLEIAWTRFFALVFGSSTYSFATMLSALILGISFGSLFLTRLESKIKHPIFCFGLTQILMGFCLIFSFSIYPLLPVLFEFLNNNMVPSDFTYIVYESLKFIIAFILMLLPAFFGGMSLPLIIRAFISNDTNIAKDCGLVYAADTIGNVTGALLAALLLMPLLGIQYLLVLISVSCVILGSFSLFISNLYERRRSLKSYFLMVFSLLLLSLNLIIQHWKLEYFTLVPTRRSSLVTFSSLIDKAESIKVIYSNDDPASSIMVAEDKNQKRVLLNNGKPDASDDGDMNTQLLLGHIPLVVNPHIKDVCVIGLGSGVTAGSILKHKVDSLHVIELTKAIVEAQKYFSHVNSNSLNDKRLKLTVDDARSVLTYDNKKYDAIISEPSNPWQAGVAKLFTQDFYELVKNRLNPHGYFVQWLQLYESNNELFLSSIRTLRTVFPYLYGFRSQAGDLIILCANKPIKLRSDDIKLVFNNENLMNHFSSRSWATPEQFFSLQTHSPQSMDAFASLGLFVNNSDNLILEHKAPMATFMGNRVHIISSFNDNNYQSTGLLYNAFLTTPFVANFDNSFQKKNPHLSKFLNSNLIADHYTESHKNNKKIDVLDTKPTFLFYEYLDLQKLLFKYAKENKWKDFTRIWSPYKNSLVLFLYSNLELRTLWKQKIKIWLNSHPSKVAKRELLRFAFNLESYDKDSAYLNDLFNDYVDLEDRIFSTEIVSKYCQILSPRDCINLKSAVLQKIPNHPIGSLYNFPRNLWSISK